MEEKSVLCDLRALARGMYMIYSLENGAILTLGVDEGSILPAFKGEPDGYEYIANWFPESHCWGVDGSDDPLVIMDMLDMVKDNCDYLAINPPLMDERVVDLIPVCDALECVDQYIFE